MKTRASIQAFLRNRQAMNRKPKTIQWYKEQLTRFAQSYPELPTDPESIEQFLAGINSSPETKRAYYRTLKAFFYNFASRRFQFANPIDQIGPPSCPAKIMPTLEPREMMRLINAATTPKDEALISLFADTGGRTTELATLSQVCQSHLRQHKVRALWFHKTSHFLSPLFRSTLPPRAHLVSWSLSGGKDYYP